MARYPTYEDYEQKRNFSDGVKRCDELLKKSPKDVQLLTTKYRLLYANRTGDAQQVLDELVDLQTRDLQDIIAVEQAVIESKSDVYPPLSSAGPSVAKIWDAAVKAATTPDQKWELASIRLERAVLDNRLTDAQQALIQLKAIQPKNRVVYMAHAAFTQLMSTSNEDLQARLAIGLARKVVAEKFDDDQSLDCRVSGQIFALQGSVKDLVSITGRRFGDSKHVYDVARQKTGNAVANGIVSVAEVPNPQSVPSHVWLAAEIDSLKRTFAALMGQGASLDEVRAFALNAIRLFHASVTTLSSGARRSPAGACFLSISALVKLFEQTDEQGYLLQAAFLAETLLRYDPHIHEARLMLVYLHMQLGLGSLAMRFFDSLNIKEVQHDTIGHALFTRLSLIHPFTTAWAKKEGLDPFKRTSQALNVYVRCEDKLVETETSVLSNGQTGMIFDLQELRNSLRASLPRRITLLEQRRIARLTRDGPLDDEVAKVIGPLVCANWMHAKDNRDLNAAFDYGYNVERTLYGKDGILPGTAWILSGLVADSAWSIATEAPAIVKDSEELLRQVRKLKAVVTHTPLASELGMTAAELLAGDVACCSLEFLLSVQPDQEIAEERRIDDLLAAIVTSVEALQIDALAATSDTLAEHLLDHYAYADALRLVIVGCRYARKYAGGSVGVEIQELQDQAKRLFARLQQHAVEQQAYVKATNVRQHMSRDEEIWKDLQQFGGEGLDAFCEAASKSAKEGWEGVTKIRLV